MAIGAPPPVVELPERLDRKLRLGPFPSGRDALKFVTYAAAGAVLVPFLGPVVWLLFVFAGAVVTLWHPDDEPIDERAVRLARWQARRWRREEPVSPTRTAAPGRRAIARLPSSFVAVLRAGGLPLAYLPGGELASRFEQYRDLFRALDGSFLLLVTRAPIHATPFLPAEPTPPGAERAARAGYRELVEVIVRRRHVRQVYLAVATPATGPEGIGRLETQVASLGERLRALGVRPVRLRDRALADAIHRLGIQEGDGAG